MAQARPGPLEIRVLAMVHPGQLAHQAHRALPASQAETGSLDRPVSQVHLAVTRAIARVRGVWA